MNWQSIKTHLHDQIATILAGVIGVLFVLVGLLWIHGIRLEGRVDRLGDEIARGFEGQTKTIADLGKNLDGKLSSQDRQMERFEARMDRWSMQFPVLASTELSQAIQFAVVTTAPQQVSGAWARKITVFDVTANQKSSFSVTAADPQTAPALAALQDAADTVEERPLTLLQIAKLASVSGTMLRIPANIDAANSFVFSGPAADFADTLQAKLQVAPQQTTLDIAFGEPRELVVELQRRPVSYAMARP